MENQSKKCSNNKHSEVSAMNYCPECNLYLCNKCTNTHSEFFENHQVYNLNTNINELFTGKCSELKHKLSLEYFCKNHNKLCCAACLSKIKGKGDGQHFDCDVCYIEDIKEEKKSKLNENIQYLEELSKTIESSINELKNIFEKINENKEELKIKISSIFTKIRNSINVREDELLLEVDNIFGKNFVNEDMIKQGEQTPAQIKLFLEKGKTLSNNWDDNKLISNINVCINIENNIKHINEINENIKKNNSKKINIQFLTNESEINKFMENIKSFGQLGENKFIFKFMPNNKYTINNNGLSAIKNSNGWDGVIIGDKEIPKNKISKWKIKLNSDLNISYDDLYIGIGNNNVKSYNDFWSFYSHLTNVSLNKKGSITNYKTNKEKIKKGDIIEVIVDRILGNLSFAVNEVNYGIAFSDIPKDDVLYPTVLLYEKNLNIEII